MRTPLIAGLSVAGALVAGIALLNLIDDDRIDVTASAPDVAVDSVSVDRVSATTGDAAVSIDPIVGGTLVLPDGSYEMVGYGTVLVVEGDELTLHYVTPTTCTEGETLDNEIDVDHAASDGGQIIVDQVGSTTDYRLRPLVDRPECDSGPADALTAVDEVFSTHYPFFAERGMDWPATFAALEAAVDDGASVPAALAGMMLELGDGHTLLPGLDETIDVAAFGVDELRTVDDLADLLDYELDDALGNVDEVSVDATGTVGWGVLRDRPDVGYLFLGGFENTDEAGADREALVTGLDAAIADLAAVDRLIVDLRFNAGGYEDLAVVAAGYFVDEAADGYHKWAHAEPDPLVQTVVVEPQAHHFDGEIAILTSPLTASAAEAFLLAMRSTTDATLVGMPSDGGFSDAIDWQLPDGTTLTMSMEVYTDLDGTGFEAVGVPVDVTAGFDTAVGAALALWPTTSR